ncbi:MAG: glycoside hydrolase family 13 protein [Mycoplasmatales bacterium]
MNRLIGYEHLSMEPYVYALDKKTVQVRLKTPTRSVQKVIVEFGDPYDWREIGNSGEYQIFSNEKEMELIGTDGRYDWYVANLHEPYKRLSYSFKVTNIENETIIIDEKGVYIVQEDFKTYANAANRFNFPYFFEENVFNAPKWVEETIWYQIFPDRFKRVGEFKSTLDWEQEIVTNQQIFGGNIQGIISELDYLEELGVTGLYFTPLFKAATPHKYDTEDYYQIDPSFGTEADFKELISKAHQRGIRIMLDGVFNHTSRLHPLFIDVIEHKEKSKYYNWFYINDTDNLRTVADANYRNFKEEYPYETFGHTQYMPKLNTENPEVIEYFKQVVKYWTEFGIDGWRLDVANELSHSFIKELRKQIRAINPECYYIGEIWHESQNWLRGDEFDAVMNYVYTNPMIDFFARQTISAEELANRLMYTEMTYNSHVCANAFNVVDTHDTERILYTCQEDKVRLRFLQTFLLSQKGSPCIYYGTEIGMSGDGKKDNNNRRPMVWAEQKQDMQLLEFFKQIIAFRKANAKFLNQAKLTIVQTEPFSFITTNETRTINYLFNTSAVALDVSEIVNNRKIAVAVDLQKEQLQSGGILIYE